MRPHPLFGATIESMRSELSEKYREIVEKYQDDEWGIYDDSGDMERAVCLSDGYYGDWSSVLWLYQATKKKTVIQNVRILSNREMILGCADIVKNKAINEQI